MKWLDEEKDAAILMGGMFDGEADKREEEFGWQEPLGGGDALALRGLVRAGQPIRRGGRPTCTAGGRPGEATLLAPAACCSPSRCDRKEHREKRCVQASAWRRERRFQVSLFCNRSGPRWRVARPSLHPSTWPSPPALLPREHGASRTHTWEKVK